MTTWRELCSRAQSSLEAAGIDGAAAQARWMIEEVSGYGASELFRSGPEHPSDRAVARVESMVARRVAGEPVQYVLGHWSFRRLDLLVDRRVLIPRPETEVVAEVALEEAVRLGAKRGKLSNKDPPPLRGDDPCTSPVAERARHRFAGCANHLAQLLV